MHYEHLESFMMHLLHISIISGCWISQSHIWNLREENVWWEKLNQWAESNEWRRKRHGCWYIRHINITSQSFLTCNIKLIYCFFLCNTKLYIIFCMIKWYNTGLVLSKYLQFSHLILKAHKNQKEYLVILLKTRTTYIHEQESALQIIYILCSL